MRFLGLIALLLLTASQVSAQRVMNYGKAPAGPTREPNLPAIGIDQHLDEQVPLDLVFRDEHDNEVTLGSCVGGKATILVLAYYRCPNLCNQVLNGVVESLKKIPGNIGEDYNVVTVSFDPKDIPGAAAAKKLSYMEEYGRPGAEKGWYFLTGQQPSIEALCKAVGFRYEYDKVKKQYNHASGIMVITPFGKLSKYFYGISYDDKELREAIVGASKGQIGKEVEPNKILMLLCYEYDPVSGQYTFTVMKALRIVFGTLVVCLSFWLVRVWRRPTKMGPGPDSSV